VREESHLDDMRAAIRGDFDRLAKRRGGQDLMQEAVVEDRQAEELPEDRATETPAEVTQADEAHPRSEAVSEQETPVQEAHAPAEPEAPTVSEDPGQPEEPEELVEPRRGLLARLLGL
jgi:hypothetical protein